MNKPTFLDDQLFQYFEEHKEQLAADTKLIEIINGLYNLCNDYKDDKINPDITLDEVYIIMKRIFDSWDLFVNKIAKKYPKEVEIKAFVSLLKKYSYENLLMEDKELKILFIKAKAYYRSIQKLRK